MDETDRQKYLQIVTRKLVGLTAGCLFIPAFLFYILLALKWVELNQTYLVAFVFLAGLVGGFVSIQQRLPSIGLSELRELSNSWLSILLIPINGGIFAIVLHIIFLSGIVEGGLFPKYQHGVENIDREHLVDDWLMWLRETFPAKGTDIAKLLFWSFAAGFSERFVPQIIHKTTDKADTT